jgi:general secretion pathway protein D
LAAAHLESGLLIIPVAEIRSRPMPTVTSMDAKLPESEVVTYVRKINYAEATMLVPILRPLLPQSAQLSAAPASNTLIFVDYYDNIKRLAMVIDTIDTPSTKREEAAATSK